MREDKQPEDVCRECVVMHRASMEWETGVGLCKWCINHRLSSNKFTQYVPEESEIVNLKKKIKILEEQIKIFATDLFI